MVTMAAQPDAAAVTSAKPFRFSGRLARTLLVTGLLATASGHVPVAIQHIAQVPYLGWGMAAFVVAAAASAGSVLVEDRAEVWAATCALSLAALVVFTVSRLVGLPGAADDRGDWSNPVAWICVVAEIIVVAVTATALLQRRQRR